ncbi:hypothetical protein LMG29542_07629 [Paraburkholderia humisilvae]|uniref:Uncharacterized protein n=1 Tax=Paraburkholderia humisilvae TaxID=627669 RepID=A0A6J5FAE7_9BURK|nr:hypothetical protein LMG29542_07629 [Paraburkholderia humisilvae]
MELQTYQVRQLKQLLGDNHPTQQGGGELILDKAVLRRSGKQVVKPSPGRSTVDYRKSIYAVAERRAYRRNYTQTHQHAIALNTVH